MSGADDDAPRRLLFLPGAGGSAQFWRPVGERLPAHWHKHYFAWPGLGHEPPSPAVRGFDDLLAMVLSALDDTPVDLLAQSMGGALALRIALDHPARVRRLVLSATAGGLDVAALGAADWRPSYRAEYPQAAPWITTTLRNYEAELSRVTHPTLLLWSDADPISPPAVGARLQGLLQNARLEVLSGGDHGFVNARADELVPLIHAHLA